MRNRLDTFNPVNRGHPLNQGKVAWWMVLPHLMGGPNWPDLMSGQKGSLGASTLWTPSSVRPGAMGR